jgi:hypothetical protein
MGAFPLLLWAITLVYNFFLIPCICPGNYEEKKIGSEMKLTEELNSLIPLVSISKG